MIKLLGFIATLLKDKHFIVFSLFGGMLYFSQLYAKLGYLATSLMFKDAFIAYITAVIFGLFAGTANTALILNNKAADSNRSKSLMAFDIVISLFFYGGVCWEAFFKKGADPKMIGVAIGVIVLGVYSSYLIYSLSEQFRQDNLDDAQETRNQQDAERQLMNVLAEAGKTLPNNTQSLPTLARAVANAMKEQADATKNLANQVEELRNLPEQLAEAQETIAQTQASLQDATGKLAGKEQELATLKDSFGRLQETHKQANAEIQRLNNTRAMAAEKGNVVKLLNAGKIGEALQKKQEIEKKYGITLDIEIPELADAALA